ncbi:Os07g0598051 [Oryza sativa Japonica Group]|uniref:Os07g0598051 protein n=1 Tax=Oryza sativa subsp. japonica TaxID=39947 RepID=A0A0P0X8P1_ORYSJ|nr:Os07g0598051 [Oryza sativa Japonica Group]
MQRGVHGALGVVGELVIGPCGHLPGLDRLSELLRTSIPNLVSRRYIAKTSHESPFKVASTDLLQQIWHLLPFMVFFPSVGGVKLESMDWILGCGEKCKSYTHGGGSGSQGGEMMVPPPAAVRREEDGSMYP